MCRFAVAANRPHSIPGACKGGIPFRAGDRSLQSIYFVSEVWYEKLREVI